jgi:hypothetical protein
MQAVLFLLYLPDRRNWRGKRMTKFHKDSFGNLFNEKGEPVSNPFLGKIWGLNRKLPRASKKRTSLTLETIGRIVK